MQLMPQKRPRLYYGWYIALSLAITTTVGYGTLYYAFSVYLTPMEAELGWSRSVLTGGFSLSLLVAGAIAYPVGWWVDKYGARLIMTLGSIGAAFLVIAWSQVTTIAGYYAVWALIGVCGAAILYEPAFAIIATWFSRYRGRALTIVTFAAGFASTIFLPFSDYLLRQFGWRDGVFILGILLGIITIPLNGLLIRHRPQDLGLRVDGHSSNLPENEELAIVQPNISVQDAIQSRFFWLLTLSFLIAGFGASAVRVHFIPYLTGIGVASSIAATASGSIGIMQVIGRLAFAPIESRTSGSRLLAGLFLMQVVAIAALLSGVVSVAIALFVTMFGASVGMRTLIRPSILADTYGAGNYGRISSIMALPLTISGTIAPVFASIMYDFFGNYDVLLIIAVLLSVVATVVAVSNTPQ